MQKDLKFNFSLLKKGIYIVKIKDLKINTLYKTNDGYKYIIKFNEGKVEYIGKNCFGTEPIVYFADSILNNVSFLKTIIFKFFYIYLSKTEKINFNIKKNQKIADEKFINKKFY